MDKLSLIKLFVSVVDLGNFTAVANQLGQSPSTVSKAIARLEQDLGVRLVHRTTRQLQLTEAGFNYLETAREVINLLKSSEEQLQVLHLRLVHFVSAFLYRSGKTI
ncbi:TPA: LysR family transcriptional regulator [Vibrio diabolicus]